MAAAKRIFCHTVSKKEQQLSAVMNFAKRAIAPVMNKRAKPTKHVLDRDEGASCALSSINKPFKRIHGVKTWYSRKLPLHLQTLEIVYPVFKFQKLQHRPFLATFRVFGQSSSYCNSSKLQCRNFSTLLSDSHPTAIGGHSPTSILNSLPCFGIQNRKSYSMKEQDKKQRFYVDKGQSSRLKLYYTLKQYIRSPENAETFVSHLKEDEKRFLLDALNASIGIKSSGNEEPGGITRRQLYLVFLHNCIPFIGFGFLDNAIMILAGEYIDHTIGFTLGITTMAAAALGNTISDLAGIGLAGYVEMLFLKLGLPVPALTPEQAEQTSTIFSSNMGKAFGILIGCLIGMFPLLFIGDDREEETK